VIIVGHAKRATIRCSIRCSCNPASYDGAERRRIFESEWRVGMTGRQLPEALRMSPGGIHSASVRGEAFVRENGDLEKSLISYLNN